jgi:DNA-binding SARP family transcriptional activator
MISLKGWSADDPILPSRGMAVRRKTMPVSTPAAAGVLRSRLVAPRLPPACVARPELVSTVVEGLSGRLVAMVAGAGFGKTTLLTLALHEDSMPFVWVSCDERMTSARSLLAHLVAGTAERFPGFGARMELAGDLDDQVVALSNEIAETIADPFLLALDDVHTLVGRPSGSAIELLVRDLPPTVHLAVTSRSRLPFSVARLRTSGLTEISEADLALSHAETAELVRSVGVELSKERVTELHDRTEGWAAGIILGLKSSTAPTALDAHLFDYLADEVFLRRPETTQRFLLATSVLERFTPELAAAVSGEPRAEELLRELVEEHLFTIRLDGEGDWYRYHHLFQAFLRRRLAEVDPGRIRELHLSAANAWRSAGEPIDAVRHFLEAGDTDAAVGVLEPIAEGMANGPEADLLAAWLDAVPEASWSDRPGLVLSHASLLLTRGEYEGSFEGFERAIERLLALAEQERAAAALLRLLQAMVSSGTRPDRRIATGRKYLERIDPGARMLPAARIMQAAAYAYACRFSEAEHELAAAIAAPAASSWEAIHVYASVTRAFYIDYQFGRGEEALLALEDAIADLERHADEDELGFVVYARLFHVYLLADLGRYEDALAGAERTQDAARLRGIGRGTERALSWSMCMSLAGLDRWEDLAAFLAPPGQASARTEPTSYGYRLRIPAARLAVHRGDAAQAGAHAQAARRELQSYGRVSDAYMVYCDLAVAVWEGDLVDLADELATEAHDAAAAMGGTRGLARAALVRSAVATDPAVADRMLAEALRLTAELGHEGLWKRRYRRLSGALLARALEHGLGPPGFAARLAADCGGEVFADCARRLASAPREVRVALASVAGDAAAVSAEVVEDLLRDRDQEVRAAAHRSQGARGGAGRPPIVISSLGGLTVRRGDVALPSSAFGRERARGLLAALLCQRGPVHRERLLDWFWPDLPVDRGLRAFHVTLYALRRALEPELARRAASSVVVSEGEAYRIELGADDRWDADEFLRLAGAAARARGGPDRLDQMLAAEALHAGALFPEWPYAPWADECRQEVEVALKACLEDLADELMDGGQPGAAVPRYERLIALEPEREASHRGVMRAYALAGERPLALRQFHACRAVLRRELGVEPGAETRELYGEILRGEDEPAFRRATAVDPSGLPLDGTLTVVFTDIAGSTELAERLGDARWAGLIAEHDAFMREHASVQGGHVVKGQGDGLMLAFASARRAIDFAIAAQRGLARLDASTSGERLLVRIGLHTGEAVRQDDDLLGRTVIMAARIAEVCAPGEITVSELVKELTESAGDLRFDAGREVALKGLAGPKRIHTVAWEPEVPPVRSGRP